MTYRDFDNKCAELADAVCDIGEKTLVVNNHYVNSVCGDAV
jgi:hypothetical protein